VRVQIRSLQKRIGITTVYVTHDQEEAMAISDRIAVMERGAVVQDGTAQDLYYRPATEFVARFIGRTNLLVGKVVTAEEVDVEGLHIPLRTTRAIGDTVRLIVRPEMIDIAPAAADETGTGRIAQRTFLGEKTDYEITLGGTTLQVTRSDAFRGAPLDVGDAVRVSIDPTRLHALG
jgi:ABC-type Fe3+/spermidine/putrescine transport system ATPase subunit